MYLTSNSISLLSFVSDLKILIIRLVTLITSPLVLFLFAVVIFLLLFPPIYVRRAFTHILLLNEYEKLKKRNGRIFLFDMVILITWDSSLEFIFAHKETDCYICSASRVSVFYFSVFPRAASIHCTQNMIPRALWGAVSSHHIHTLFVLFHSPFSPLVKCYPGK